LKRYEVESLVKTFVIFFTFLEILLSVIFWQEYKRSMEQFSSKVQLEMKLCAYSSLCDGLSSSIVNDGNQTKHDLSYHKNNFYSYYRVNDSVVKVVYPTQKYNALKESLKYDIIKRFLIYTIIYMIITLLFALYALRPIRQAIILNEEFAKDILHDFNTPISSMKINFRMLKKEIGVNQKIDRIETNIETIISLQNNLQIFLKGLHNQADRFDIYVLVKNRIAYFQTLYNTITYISEVDNCIVITNKDAFTRILDNLLSNAGKYNKPNGEVKVYFQHNKLVVEDTGNGIKNPSMVFKRYYKEQDRGIGIGLHIVKKLCDELHLKIKVKSKEGVGTKMIIDLSSIV